MVNIFVHSEKALDIDGNVVNIHHHVNSNPKVVGYIVLPDAPQKHKCVCDDCGCEVNDSWWNPRVKISTFYSKDAKKPSAVRWVCVWCADEQFGDSSPKSIFE